MRGLNLVATGLAIALLVAACSSQRPTAADLTKTAAQTQTALDEAFADDMTQATDEEYDDRYYDGLQTQAAQMDAAFEAQAADEQRERNEAVRDCILAGNNDTLCEMDPYNP
jgi:hypothetical protein